MARGRERRESGFEERSVRGITTAINSHRNSRQELGHGESERERRGSVVAKRRGCVQAVQAWRWQALQASLRTHSVRTTDGAQSVS